MKASLSWVKDGDRKHYLKLDISGSLEEVLEALKVGHALADKFDPPALKKPTSKELPIGSKITKTFDNGSPTCRCGDSVVRKVYRNEKGEQAWIDICVGCGKDIRLCKCSKGLKR